MIEHGEDMGEGAMIVMDGQQISGVLVYYP